MAKHLGVPLFENLVILEVQSYGGAAIPVQSLQFHSALHYISVPRNSQDHQDLKIYVKQSAQ